MPGPPPTPKSILAARGSHRAKGSRKSRKQEPQLDPAAPVCPKHLSKAAKTEWKRMVGILEPTGILTNADGEQLALYCAARARWDEAEKHLAEDGAVVASPSGYPIQNPWLSIANKAMEQCNKYLAKFGMNPADRARVNVAKPKPKEPPKPTGVPILKIAR